MTPARIQLEMGSPFRRRRFLAPHRRRRVWLLLLRSFLAALVSVTLPAGALVWLLSAPQFRLARPVVQGTAQVPAEWVQEALEPLRGRHLLWLSLDEVERRLTGNPWIQGVEIRKQLPDELRVQVIERRPVALLPRPDGLYYLGADGVVIAPHASAAGPADLLLVSAPDEALPAMERVREIVEALERIDPVWGEELTEIEILNDEDLRLHTAALPFPVVLAAGRIESGLLQLKRRLPEIVGRFPRLAEVDLRFSRQIVLQPAAPPPSRRG